MQEKPRDLITPSETTRESAIAARLYRDNPGTVWDRFDATSGNGLNPADVRKFLMSLKSASGDLVIAQLSNESILHVYHELIKLDAAQRAEIIVLSEPEPESSTGDNMFIKLGERYKNRERLSLTILLCNRVTFLIGVCAASLVAGFMWPELAFLRVAGYFAVMFLPVLACTVLTGLLVPLIGTMIYDSVLVPFLDRLYDDNDRYLAAVAARDNPMVTEADDFVIPDGADATEGDGRPLQ